MGSNGYTFISTVSGNGVYASRSTSPPTATAPPKVVSHSSGNCGPAGAGSPGARPTVPTRPAPVKQANLVLTQNTGAQPYANIVRQVAAAPQLIQHMVPAR